MYYDNEKSVQVKSSLFETMISPRRCSDIQINQVPRSSTNANTQSHSNVMPLKFYPFYKNSSPK